MNIDEQGKQADAAAFDILAIASSAGGLNALSTVLSGLSGGLPIPVVVVQHLDPRHKSLMAEILGRRTELQTVEAVQGTHLENGFAYIAPPDQHLLIDPGGTISLTRSELVHFVRPSADLLYESVAATYGDRSIAVVLSGSGSDGSMGVKAVKLKGGTVIAQDEKSSEFFGMPGAAIATGSVDFILPLEDIASAINTLISSGGVS